MAGIDLSVVRAEDRPKAAVALAAAFGPAGAGAVTAVAGGASGAGTYRVATGTGDHLLRIEGVRLRGWNPHQYTCLELAAAAGIAPPVRYLDAEAGVVVMAFLDVRPLAEFPGGPPAAAAAGADLLAELHRVTTFPELGDHLDNLDRLLAYVDGMGRVREGQLARCREALAVIRSVYPWDPSTFVSAHNDPNEFNLLYDGTRLWLVDWETARRNDPFIDLATLCGHLAPTSELRDVVLRRALGTEPDDVARARLVLAAQLVRLFAGCMLLVLVGDPAEPADLDAALSPDEFAAATLRGDLPAGDPRTIRAYGVAVLRAFLDRAAAADGSHADALAVLRTG